MKRRIYPFFNLFLLCICLSNLINGQGDQKLIILLSCGRGGIPPQRFSFGFGCIIKKKLRSTACDLWFLSPLLVTAGWAPGMGGLISRPSIRSLLAVLEMGGNTIELQFDFKPHRSISWTPHFWDCLLSFFFLPSSLKSVFFSCHQDSISLIFFSFFLCLPHFLSGFPSPLCWIVDQGVILIFFSFLF